MKTKPRPQRRPSLDALFKSRAFSSLSPTDKLVAMLKVEPLEKLLAAGHVYNARAFGERVGYSYDHVRRLCRAGKLDPAPVMLGAGKVWREYFFLPEHIDAVFAARPTA